MASKGMSVFERVWWIAFGIFYLLLLTFGGSLEAWRIAFLFLGISILVFRRWWFMFCLIAVALMLFIMEPNDTEMRYLEYARTLAVVGAIIWLAMPQFHASTRSDSEPVSIRSDKLDS